MMRWLVRLGVRSAGLVVALGAAVMVLGIVQLRDMPVDVLHTAAEGAGGQR